MPHRRMFLSTETAQLREFLLAGRAVVTLKSLKTNEYYTFEVRGISSQEKGFNYWQVSVLQPGNKYWILGSVGETGWIAASARQAKCPPPSAKAFKWFWAGLTAGQPLPTSLLEVWHEGKCGRCGRPLTHPDSIASGIGPECKQLIAGQQFLENL